MTLTVEEAIARAPQWVDINDLKVSPLDGGITNSNFRVDISGESFALRIAGTNTDLLGINREHEYVANLTAGKLGIAPEVIHVKNLRGIWLHNSFLPAPFSTKKLPSRTISAALRKLSKKYTPCRKY